MPVQPRYSIVPAVNPSPDLTQRRTPTISEEVQANWRLGWAPKLWDRIGAETAYEPDKDFDPWTGLEGYEEYARDIIAARSKPEQDAIKKIIDNSRRDQELASRGEWGLIAGMIAGVGDPTNLLPIPAAKGLGIVRGALSLGGAFGALSTATEVARNYADPTVTGEEMLYSIGISSLLGGIIGAPVGAFGARSRRAMREFEAALADVDSPNWAMQPRGNDEGIRFEYGVKPIKDVDGARGFFSLAEEPGAYAVKVGRDGINYVWSDNSGGWIRAADIDVEAPRAAGPDIADELGIPERSVDRVMRIDEAGLKNRYRKGQWQDEITPLLKEGDQPVDQLVRIEDDYVAFRTIRRLWEDRLPRNADESVEDWRQRTGELAWKEYKATKADLGYAGSKIVAGVLERLNLSPVAKAIRVFAGDNRVADTALRLGGDYGWMVHANKYGIRTPPSVLLSAMKHTARWVKFRSEFDKQWLRFASGKPDHNGVSLQSFNLSSAAWAVRQGGRRLAGRNVLTYDDFAEMVGKAVYTPGEFAVNGHPVNQYAREAAKAYTQMMEEFDMLARDAGIYKDQRQVQSDIKWWTDRRRRAQEKMLDWLWKDGEPSALQKAVKLPDGRIYTGDDFNTIVSDIIDDLGDEGFTLTEQLTPDDFGYVQRPRAQQAMEHPAPGEFDDVAPDYQPGYEKFQTLGEALDYAVSTIDDPGYADLVKVIKKQVADMPFRVVSRDELDEALAAGADLANLDKWAAAIYDSRYDHVVARGAGFSDFAGTNPEVIIHEAIHGVVARRLHRGMTDVQKGRDTPHARLANEMSEMWADVRSFTEQLSGLDLDQLVETFPGFDKQDVTNLTFRLGLVDADIQELVTYGLTSPELRAIMQASPWQGRKTMWDRFLDIVRRLIGLTPKQMTQYDRLRQILIDAGRTPDLKGLDFYGEVLRAEPNVSRETSRFTRVEDVYNQRIESLTDAQRAVFDERRLAVTQADEQLAILEAQAADADKLHQFKNAAGDPEAYFTRYYDKSEIAASREKFTRLVTKWYERDNPSGARERAEATVDRILNEEQNYTPTLGGARSLNARGLNIPNSFAISDAELGEIAMTDFIENNVLSISEAYTKRMGINIELGRMFGDVSLEKEKARLRDYLATRYLDDIDPVADRPAFDAALAKINEAMGWIDITAKSMTGQLRTSDPWRLDNRIARGASALTTFATMGRVLLTAVPEMFRAPMTQGFGTAFRTVFMRYLEDLEQLRPNIKFMQIAGEVTEMAMGNINARMLETMENGDPLSGGTWFEKQLMARMPGFFRLTGLTSWTVFAKEWVMLSAQHSVMSEAKRIGEAIKGGHPPSRDDVARLAALGINERDAILLSEMPTWQHGSLIMPAVDDWQGTAGRKAREALLTAIHAEARRAIVTPAIGDKSTVFNGVWSSGGKKQFETDIMRLPMQFLGYGMAAHNKVLASAIQGRDRSVIGGILFMILGGIMSQYLKLNENSWKNKSYDEVILSGIEAAGIGGYWFGDINSQIERFTGNRVGIRPALGMDPKFGKGTDMDGIVDAAGAAPGHFLDISRAFWDPDKSMSQRAQLIRRGIPYNNIIWWNTIFRDMAGGIGSALEGSANDAGN